MPPFDLSILLSGPYHEMLLAGLRLSLILLASAFILALPLGTLVALARLSPFVVLRGLGTLFIESQRNVPLLAHLLFWYFGAPELLPGPARQWLYDHDFETIAAVVGITLYYAAFMSEDVRSGIRAVPAVQFEAARSLGLPWLASMRIVVLPQALRVVVPPLLSQTLNIWKDTSIATVIGTAELMNKAARVESETFHSFEPFAFATLSCLAVSLLISALASGYHRRFPARTL